MFSSLPGHTDPPPPSTKYSELKNTPINYEVKVKVCFPLCLLHGQSPLKEEFTVKKGKCLFLCKMNFVLAVDIKFQYDETPSILCDPLSQKGYKVSGKIMR